MSRLLHRLTRAGVTPRPFLLTATLAILLAGTASAQSTFRCESINNSRQECRFAGAGTVQLSLQLSIKDCIQGQSWGVNGNTVWVDRGCRADFTLLNDSTWLHDGTSSPTAIQNNDRRQQQGMDGDNRRRETRTITVVCESRDGRRHRCAADTLGQITLGRQLTRNNKCVEGRTWGYDSSGIWVDRGCRAEFSIADNGGTYRDRGPSQAMRTFVCESHDSKRTYCRADARFGVSLMREMSRNNCVVNETWGTDRDGVWVSNGCRAEFAVKTRL